MPAEKHPTATVIERLFSAIGCGFLCAILAVIAMLSILYFTQPPLDLGWGPSFYCGGGVGAMLGWIYPRIGQIIGSVFFFFSDDGSS